jgi:hypothetical protein
MLRMRMYQAPHPRLVNGQRMEAASMQWTSAYRGPANLAGTVIAGLQTFAADTRTPRGVRVCGGLHVHVDLDVGLYPRDFGPFSPPSMDAFRFWTLVC